MFLFGIEILATDIWLKFLVAIICATAIGLERNYKNKPVGVRTCNLVTIGTVVFVIISQALIGGDPGRIISQIVNGIGFIGAGSIMSQNGSVVGITSAAVIWILAAIGCAIGLGMYQLAFVVTGIVGLVLFFAGKLENKFKNWLHD